jgi:uncharacterized protein YraI
MIAPVLALMVLLLAGCGAAGAEATPLPTRTPLPTFTPTPEGAQPPAAPSAPTEDPAQPPAGDQEAQAPVTQPVADPAQATPAQPAGETQAATEAPTAEPTATPAPANAEVTTNDVVNIRQGPGTNYNLVGSAQAGTKFRVTGKNQAGDWWQIDYNGQPGWVFGQLVTASNTQAVALAQNIPAAPTAAPPPPPTNTPVPQATQPPAPTQPPKSTYKFNVVVVSKCLPQEAGNWFEGKTYVNGQPQSGFKVVFSYAPDGPHVTPPVQSGPHPGYEGWDAGYYSHIINAAGPKDGNWFVWVVDDGGQRISEIGNWQSKGPGGDCNQAVVDFDSR